MLSKAVLLTVIMLTGVVSAKLALRQHIKQTMEGTCRQTKDFPHYKITVIGCLGEICSVTPEKDLQVQFMTDKLGLVNNTTECGDSDAR